MDTIELQYILDKSFRLRPLHGVVCPKDQLPEQNTSRAYIVNTHNANQPGEHWVMLFFKENKAIYFDSYGLPPLKEHIQPFLEKNARSYTYNQVRYQSGNSVMCGVYCIFALDTLAQGKDLDSVLTRTFQYEPKYYNQNDKQVCEWFKQVYGRLYMKARQLPKPDAQCCTADQSNINPMPMFDLYVLNHDYLYF